MRKAGQIALAATLFGASIAGAIVDRKRGTCIRLE
jgi:hypothetical protein